jgi:DNA-directed RNA polymerase specialized sigma24 family protein
VPLWKTCCAPWHRRSDDISSLVGPADIDDVLQDTFVIVVRRLAGLADPGAFRSWAFRIASRETR